MPSWFHLIGIALNFFPPSVFVAVGFVFDSNLQPSPFQFLPAPLTVWVQLLDPPSLNAFWTMSVLSRLTAASYWLCLQVCVTNKTLVSIDQLLSSLFSFDAIHTWGITLCSSLCCGERAQMDSHSFCLRQFVFTNNLLPSCGVTGNCIGPLSIPTLLEKCTKFNLGSGFSKNTLRHQTRNERFLSPLLKVSTWPTNEDNWWRLSLFKCCIVSYIWYLIACTSCVYMLIYTQLPV